MSVIAAALKHMLASGMPHEAIVAAVADMEAAMPKDAQAERRRAADRERKRLRKSAESAESADEVSPKKETSPTPPKEKTTPSTTEPNGSSKTRAARLPADWVLPVEWRQDALKAGLPADRIEAEAEKMRDWSLSSPNGAKRDWRAAWRNWAKSAVERLPKSRGSPPRKPAERYDPFNAFAEELASEQHRDTRSDQGHWDDVEGLPVLTIDYQR